jgi:hypothetical protein
MRTTPLHLAESQSKLTNPGFLLDKVPSQKKTKERKPKAEEGGESAGSCYSGPRRQEWEENA